MTTKYIVRRGIYNDDWGVISWTVLCVTDTKNIAEGFITKIKTRISELIPIKEKYMELSSQYTRELVTPLTNARTNALIVLGARPKFDHDLARRFGQKYAEEQHIPRLREWEEQYRTVNAEYHQLNSKALQKHASLMLEYQRELGLAEWEIQFMNSYYDYYWDVHEVPFVENSYQEINPLQ